MTFITFKSTRKGFTLIELLVVIAIIGILSSVVLASLSTARQKARDAKRTSDIGELQKSLELFFDANQSYPTTGQGLAQLVTDNLIPQMPLPPSGSAAAYVYIGVDGAGADCAVAPCLGYAAGIDLERTDSTVLSSDADQVVAGSFEGDGDVDCTTATLGGADKCYDLKP